MLVLPVLAIGLAAAPVSAAAPPRIPLVEDWAITPNLTALSFSERSVPTSGPESNFINSDLAFWGDMVVQGHYNGFRLVDGSQPKKPREIIDYEECAPKNPTGAVPGNQGDIAIYGDILSRSWNSNTGPAGAVRAARLRGPPYLRHLGQAGPRPDRLGGSPVRLPHADDGP
jgi:hypothetical protein